jgi:hypothetical protein
MQQLPLLSVTPVVAGQPAAGAALLLVSLLPALRLQRGAVKVQDHSVTPMWETMDGIKE